MTSLKDSFDKLQPIFRAKELEGQKVDVELIKGFNKHRQSKFMEIFRMAEKEILLMTKPEGFTSDELNKDTMDFINKGGILKNIYEIGSDFKFKAAGEWKNIGKENLPDILEQLITTGEEVRIAEKVNQNMLVCDRKIVYVSLIDPTISRYNRSDIIVKNENYASSMADYFNGCWDKAFTIEEYKRKAGGTNS
jgi:hypothetical protein